MASSSGKKTRGRQKIEMKLIENEEDKLITFSKRRSGIYKKLCEISTLCGSEFLFICFSPAGKPFSFGHPSVGSVANRFMNRNVPVNDNTNALVEAHRMVRITELIQQYNQVVEQMDEAKQQEKELEERARERTGHHWWEAPIEQLNMRELEELESRHAEFLKQLYIAWNKKMADTSLMHAPMDPAQFGTNSHIASSSMLAPMDPAQLTNSHIASSSMLAPMDPAPMDDSRFNPFTTNANEHAPATFPSGEGHGPQQF